MIRHYVARRAKVIFDHPHNAADGVGRADERCGTLAMAVSFCVPEGRRPIRAIATARLIPAMTTGVSALSQPAGVSRCRASRSARYPAVIAAPSPPSVRPAAASGRRTKATIAHACAPGITTGADSAVPISTQSRLTADGCPRQNGISKAWRRRTAKAIPPSPEVSWAVDTSASTRLFLMARQLNEVPPMRNHPGLLIAASLRPPASNSSCASVLDVKTSS
jgi:hypothetical protein